MSVGADLRRSWTRAFVIGELLGFVAPAVVGATLGTTRTITGRTLGRLLVARTVNMHGADDSSATNPFNSVH